MIINIHPTSMTHSLNTLAAGSTISCDWGFEHFTYIPMTAAPGSSSQAYASEFLESLGKTIPC